MPLHQYIARRPRDLGLDVPPALHHLEAIEQIPCLDRLRRRVERDEGLPLALETALHVDVDGLEVDQLAELPQPGLLLRDLLGVGEALRVDAAEVEGARGELGVVHCFCHGGLENHSVVR
jgi:hypothetical protein